MLPDDIWDYEENVTANVENDESGSPLELARVSWVTDRSLRESFR
jgi:hypothetical protein